MLSYWFSNEDGTTEHQKIPAQIGVRQEFDGEPVPCKCGLHSSPTPWDALQYAMAGRLWEVETPDDAVPHGTPVDKHAARWRTPLRTASIDRLLREFACDRAERVLPFYETEFPEDARLRDAIDVARKFARGAATKEELAAARAAAEAAARAAARAARAAAEAAAWAAAGAAAGAAARAAWAAAGAAAEAAARAAEAAEIAWQRDEFNKRAMAALEGGE